MPVVIIKDEQSERYESQTAPERPIETHPYTSLSSGAIATVERPQPHHFDPMLLLALAWRAAVAFARR